MNAPNTWSYDEMEASYTVASTHRDQNREQRMRNQAFGRRPARPSSASGMHRRHNRKYSW